MFLTFVDLERAQLPAAALGRLATLRCEPDVEVALDDRTLWVRWQAGNDAVARSLLPLKECRLYGRHGGRWYGWRQALPSFGVPDNLRFRSLAQVLLPAPVATIAATDCAAIPIALELVADPVPRPTRGLQCSLDLFLAWADTVPAGALARYQGAIKGERLFVLGKKLPWLEGAERFWGHRLLVPLGLRPQPRVSEAELRRAAGVADSDLLILRPRSCEIVASDRFTSLTHAALRIAQAGVRP